MVFAPKTAGLALLSFGLAARQATAVINCAALITEIGSTGAAKTITLEDDIECPGAIDIAASQDVTINGGTGPFSITIATGFAGTVDVSGGSSLIVNEGTLTLENISFETAAVEGNRAVWNKGTLSVIGCTFDLYQDGAFLDEGGAIYSDSSTSIDISGSTFLSNIASERGGALCVYGSETLTITDSTFKANEVGTGATANGEGGDVYAGPNVELTVVGTLFSGSVAELGGAAIVCCGAEISNSTFNGADSFSEERHFGAVRVGGPGEEACARPLTLTDTKFSGCTVGRDAGEGGSLSIFDTSATINNCVFEGSMGTALFFESTSATGAHKLDMDYVQFNENTQPSEAYASANSQGSAVVVVNTNVGNGEVEMGTFKDMYCFGNEPYECEFVYDAADITHDGEFKCHICNIEGVRQATGLDDDFLGATDRGIDSGSDDNQGIVVGLSLALGLTLVVIGALAVWKFKVRKNARRLMEDMGEGDL